MSIFEKYYAGQYIVDFVNKTSRDYVGACANKSGNGAIGYRRKLPSVEITLPRDMCWKP